MIDSVRHLSRRLPAVLLLAVLGCDELTEVDLAGASLEVIVPRADFESERASVQFVWVALEGATDYELTVVAPTFVEVEQVVERVSTTDDAVDLVLPSGEYEWRLEAFNSVSSTRIEPRRLLVDADSLDATPPAVDLLAPGDAALLNDSPVRLLWSPTDTFSGEFRVQVARGGFTNSSFLLVDTLTGLDFFDVDPEEDGEYRWRVRTERDGAFGTYAEQTFRVDRVGPASPEPFAPTPGEFVDYPARLEWSSVGDALSYRVEVRRDAVDGDLVLSDLSGFTTVEVLDSSATNYFWRVSALDEIGNEGEPSDWSPYQLTQ